MVEIEPLFEDVEEGDVFDFDIGAYLPALEDKLKAAGLKYRVDQDDDDEYEVFIDVPAEDGVRALKVITVDECKMLLGSEFQNFHLLNNFKGIYSARNKVIECAILPVHTRDSGFVRRNARRKILDPLILEDPNDANVTITVGRMSKELTALNLNDSDGISFRINGVEFRGRKPSDIITIYANSVFFQMELLGSLPYILERFSSGRALKTRVKEGEIKFPSTVFEQAPMALYWYARGAFQLPLLKFLAYYQCVEFFFPRLSRLAAHKKVQSILKDPSFRATNDSDIEKVFNAIKLTSTGRLGDEKSQLVSVIKECLHPREIMEFIQADKVRKDHLTGVNKNGLSQHPISIKNEDGVVATTANRIYEIRCKVVHTKNEVDEDQVEVLLPNSPEADLLAIDTELMQFVAQKVLIYSSSRI